MDKQWDIAPKSVVMEKDLKYNVMMEIKEMVMDVIQNANNKMDILVMVVHQSEKVIVWISILVDHLFLQLELYIYSVELSKVLDYHIFHHNLLLMIVHFVTKYFGLELLILLLYLELELIIFHQVNINS